MHRIIGFVDLISFELKLQPFFGLASVLPGLLEPPLHTRNFLLKLPVALLSLYLQEEIVPLLQGFHFEWKLNNRLIDHYHPVRSGRFHRPGSPNRKYIG